MNWDLLPQQLVIGIQLGAIYALIALGYTMVYGVLRLINFAHGDVYMVGAYLAYYTSMQWFNRESMNPYVLLISMLVVAMVGCALLGLLIERFAYRPLRGAPRSSLLITAIGVSLLLEHGGLLVFKTAPPPSIHESVNVLAKNSLVVFGLRIDSAQLAVFVVTLILMLLLWQFVTRTKTGRAMRAVSHDFDTAALMGVDVNRIVAVTFVIGSSLAAAGGMMNATALGTPLTTFYGLIPGVKAFVAAVLGGIGNIPGAVVGGFIMGICEVLVVWAGYGGYRDAVAFVILIGILMFKPSGLFGSAAEKV
ncbi:MAG TPA: branched-chain amino acid ABC transporter permease [Fimbriimonadales bacterium]|nr:branched-chain amino acid ABC transporter permease [Fimbriimonadales bacterium]